MPGTSSDLRRKGVAVGQAPAQMPQAVHRAAFWSPRPLFGWTRSRENGLWLPKTVLA